MNNRILKLFLGLSLVLVFFQNCGPGFEMTQENLSANLSSTEGQTGQTLQSNPIIATQKEPQVLNMNVTSKVLVSVSDVDTDTSRLTFVLRSPPRFGTVRFVVGSTQGDGGFEYTPNVDFIGIDELTISAMDPEGNLAPDQKYQVHVQQKGLGQMLGRFIKANCEPNTSPVTGTYTSTLTSFEMIVRIYTSDCRAALLEHKMSGMHSIGLEFVPTTSGVTGFEYNITNNLNTVRPLSSSAATILNSQVYCGFSNWRNNVTKDISNSGCKGVWASKNLFMFRRVEFPFEGGPPRLFYSDMSTGLGISSATRTQGLDLRTVFVKQ